MNKLSKAYKKPVVVEVKPLKNFYKAEDYHQDYLGKNPGGYCHIEPGLFELARKANPPHSYQKPDDKTLRNKLTAEQYEVTQHNATEQAFKTSTGTSFGKEFMWTLPPENHCLFPQTNMNQAVAGQVFRAPLVRLLFRKNR